MVATVGVFMAYLGGWINNPYLWLAGMILAIPHFVITLPICLFFFLIFITTPVWGPIIYLVNKMHGAPFQSGDYVHILHGKNRNKVVVVYEVWSSRDQVRVNLGEKEKENYADLFSYLNVRRVQKTDVQSRDIN
ncbi:MAG: hypothetical protein ABSG67_01180 [Thermoguttaceae bacterium]